MNQGLLCNLGIGIFLLLFLNIHIQAQILAPDLICIDNDTLRWIPAVNTCGGFVSYDIYVSDSPAGPYSILGNVTDPSTDFFFHANANSANMEWYYFMESNHNCPGVPNLQSDTLDNRDPDFPLMDAVTVVGNDVEIYWTPSTSPETNGYIIFKEDATGNFVPIDTIFPETANYYLDANASPNTQTEEYTILAIDACGNTSIFNTEPQESILLDVQINECTQTADLSWNLYKNWTEGIENHEVWLGINGNTPSQIATVANADVYTYEGLNDGNTYCFSIRTNRNNSSFASTSNEICIIASIVQPNKNLYIENVTFLPSGEIQVEWQWDVISELNTYGINTSEDNISYANIVNEPVPNPLVFKNTYDIANHNGTNAPQYFQIETRDQCDSLTASNYAATIHLSGTPNADFTNTLTWTDFDMEYGQVDEFLLFRQGQSSDQFLGQFAPSDRTYTHELDYTSVLDANVCYYVLARTTLRFPNGTNEISTSRSNTVCLEQQSLVRFPNAFAPSGVNNVFRPLVVFPSQIASFDMRIFDRWGKELFQTQDFETGWNGQANGRPLQGGAYIYQAQVTDINGQVQEFSGTVVLVE